MCLAGIGLGHFGTLNIFPIYNVSKLPRHPLRFNPHTVWDLSVLLACLSLPPYQHEFSANLTTLWEWLLSETELSPRLSSRENSVLAGFNLQDIHNELYMDPMVLEVASRWWTVDVIELLAPIDIGKGVLKKA